MRIHRNKRRGIVSGVPDEDFDASGRFRQLTPRPVPGGQWRHPLDRRER